MESDSVTFNTFTCFEAIGQKHCLTVLSIHILNSLNIDQIPQVDAEIIVKFLDKINKGYDPKV